MEESFSKDAKLYAADSDLYESVYDLTLNGKVAEALSAVQARIAEGNVYVELHVLEGYVYEHMQRYQDALRSYGNGLQIDPKRAQALYRVASIQKILGEDEAYSRALEQLAAGNDDLYQPIASGHLALLAKDFALAKSSFKKASAVQADSEVLYWYATSLFYTEDYAESVRVLNQIEPKERSSASLYVLGCSLQRLKNISGARKVFQDAVHLDNDNYQAHRALGALEFKRLNLRGVGQHFREMMRISHAKV